MSEETGGHLGREKLHARDDQGGLEDEAAERRQNIEGGRQCGLLLVASRCSCYAFRSRKLVPDGVSALLRCSAAAAVVMAVVITVPVLLRAHSIEGHGLRCEIQPTFLRNLGVTDRLNDVRDLVV